MTCSSMQVRRLFAGELSGADKAQLEQHVAACARCSETQREIEREKEALLRDVPFPQFAAGVAEKLASQKQHRSWMPLLAAAAIALVAGLAVLRPSDDGSVRSKGAATAQLFVKDASGVHEAAGPVPEKASLEIVLHPSGRKYAAAVLIEPGETSRLYDGPAVNGPLPQAFEWTGARAILRVYFADEPIDLSKPPAEFTEIKLHR